MMPPLLLAVLVLLPVLDVVAEKGTKECPTVPGNGMSLHLLKKGGERPFGLE